MLMTITKGRSRYYPLKRRARLCCCASPRLAVDSLRRIWQACSSRKVLTTSISHERWGKQSFGSPEIQEDKKEQVPQKGSKSVRAARVHLAVRGLDPQGQTVWVAVLAFTDFSDYHEVSYNCTVDEMHLEHQQKKMKKY